jgi:endonuclease/exonuclease/phosphatase (EEP) superfamily protein YafD
MFLIAWNILRIWPGERVWLVALVNYFALWFGLILIPCILVALLLGDNALTAVLTLTAVLLGLRLLPTFPSSPSNNGLAVDGAYEISVLTFNVHKRNPDDEGVVEVILSEDADIVALQELTPQVSAELLSSLSGSYPYNTLQGGQIMQGQALLSKYPILSSSPLPHYRFLETRIEGPMGEMSLFNIHSPTLFPLGWREDWEEQRAFVLELVRRIRSTPGLLLVVGDFNTTPQSENYALLRGLLEDAFIGGGSGFGLTYPASGILGMRFPPPLVRIDYIFCSSHFSPIEVRVVRENGGSDHLPVMARLAVAQREQSSSDYVPYAYQRGRWRLNAVLVDGIG